MIRVFVFLAVIALLAVGLIQLVNQPSMVTVSWHGMVYGRPLWQAVLALLAVIAVLMIIIAAVRALLRAPGNASLFFRTRRRSKGFNAVTQGMIAVGSGDVRRAQKQAIEAQKILGSEPLALLLRAQAAQLSGDRSAAESAFTAMLDDPETKPLGLRGLFVEARRRGDAHRARVLAAEAVKTSPGLPWAGTALLEFQSVEKDWSGALATLARNADNRLIDKETAKRHRAVLLTARAIDQAERDRAGAKASALDALKLAPGLVPCSPRASSPTPTTSAVPPRFWRPPGASRPIRIWRRPIWACASAIPPAIASPACRRWRLSPVATPRVPSPSPAPPWPRASSARPALPWRRFCRGASPSGSAS